MGDLNDDIWKRNDLLRNQNSRTEARDLIRKGSFINANNFDIKSWKLADNLNFYKQRLKKVESGN